MFQITRVSERVFRAEYTAPGEKKYTKLSIVREDALKTEGFSGDACRCDVQDGCADFYDGDRKVLSLDIRQDILRLYIGETDGIYGLGMHQNKTVNHRNSTLWMAQKNGRNIVVPYMTSTAGYAVLFDYYGFMKIGVDRDCSFNAAFDDDCIASTPNVIHVHADMAEGFVFYVVLADGINAQIAEYRRLTGAANMFPKWAYGFLQSREHYHTQEQVVEIASEFRRRHIPIDCIIQDWHYWGDYGWNALRWDEKLYPDPKKMTDDVHAMHMHMFLSIWPSFSPDAAVTKELEEADCIIERPRRFGENWGRVQDVYNPKAGDLIFAHVKREFFDNGIDAWWLDSSEPCFEQDCSLLLKKCSPCCLGDNDYYLNTFPLIESRNYYERQLAASKDKRVCILTRSGFAGQQAVSSMTWTGDIEGRWDVLKTQITALLGYSVSGTPYTTTDIGGFFVNQYPGGNQNPGYAELYTRWFWFGVFSPIFRSHGTSTPREMWNFLLPDEKEEDSVYYQGQLAACRLRYRLMPMIYAHAYKVYADGRSFIRPLAADFADDPKVLDTEDTYLFGDSLLVSPITDPGTDEKEVYLPAGTAFYDFFTNEKYAGGQTVRVHAGLDRIPLFVREGSMILMGRDMEYTGQYPDETLEVHLYTGRDADEIYYQDAGDGEGYRDGESCRIRFHWHDGSRLLAVSAPEGCEDFCAVRTLSVYVDGEKKADLAYEKKTAGWTL